MSEQEQKVFVVAIVFLLFVLLKAYLNRGTLPMLSMQPRYTNHAHMGELAAAAAVCSPWLCARARAWRATDFRLPLRGCCRVRRQSCTARLPPLTTGEA